MLTNSKTRQEPSLLQSGSDHDLVQERQFPSPHFLQKGPAGCRYRHDLGSLEPMPAHRSPAFVTLCAFDRFVLSTLENVDPARCRSHNPFDVSQESKGPNLKNTLVQSRAWQAVVQRQFL